MVSTISEKLNIEKSFKNGFKQPLEKAPALKGKLFSCYNWMIVIYVVTGGFRWKYF